MKFYSEKLEKIFNTEKELKEAEENFDKLEAERKILFDKINDACKDVIKMMDEYSEKYGELCFTNDGVSDDVCICKRYSDLSNSINDFFNTLFFADCDSKK